MSASLIIGNTSIQDGSVVGNTILTFAGIGSYFAASFWAYESQTINRIQFSAGTVASGTAFTITAGIGTVNRLIGLPALQSGTGNTLLYNSSNTITGLTSNSTYIVSIPDFTTTAYQKYFMGLHVSQVTGASFSFQLVLKGLASSNPRLNTTPIYYRLVPGTPLVANSLGDSKYGAYNWGYDSGNGITVWYNPFPGPSRYNTNVNATRTNITGFTFHLDTDFSSIYVDNITILARNPSATFPTGFGTTWSCILYDTDGVTALTGHTSVQYSTQSNNTYNFTMPIQSWLSNKKLYHIAFSSLNSNSPANVTIATCDMPYEWQSALGFTSIFFTKSSGSANPVYTSTRVLPFYMTITDIRGSVQNSVGDVNVY